MRLLCAIMAQVMVQVTRKDQKEANENIIRRFNRKVLQSGVLASAKASMRFSKEISKTERRKSAIIRRARKEEKNSKNALGSALKVSLKEQIQKDMKAALLSGNRFEGEVLRNLKAAILNEEVSSNKRDVGLEDTEIEKLIAREVKKRKESISLYTQNGRDDLADEEKSEIDILSKYLPDPISEEELINISKGVIGDLGADNMQQMGKVISAVKSKVGTSADGATIARIVKELLSN